MIALLLNRYVLGFLGIAAMALGVMLAWSRFVAEPYREEGRVEVRDKLLPVLAKAKGQLDADVEAFAKVTAALEALKANSERLKKQASQAQKVKIVRQEVEKVRVEVIEKIVPAGATECERVTDVIEKALR